ncbi:lactonase family protein [Microbacterium sp.]|jgi:6-phosphogluconolactonase|uniref:lactonase family protein n=1 Tax=Microbacterium sp. TaxID=51671 RepID=UPI0037C917CB
MRFWVGGYSSDMEGTAEGIGLLTAGEDGSPFASGPLSFRGAVRPALASPSWIAAHPRLDVVYAALEGEGRVAALARTGDTSFTGLGPSVEAGEAVCHIAVSPGGEYLLASCWGDGRVVRIALDGSGRPTGRAVAQAARDPYGVVGADPRDLPREDVDDEPQDPRVAAERREERMSGVPADRDADRRQAAIGLADAAAALRAAAGAEFAHLIPDHDRPTEPDVHGGTLLTRAVDADQPTRTSRAHAAAFLPDGRALTTDLGFDLVRVWRTAAGRLVADHDVTLPRGSGPRHLVVHPSGFAYVLTEHSAEVFVLGADRAGRWSVRGSVPAAALTLPDDAGAELAASHDRAFLYAGLRGSDTIAVLRVVGDGSSLEPVALAESGVTWPRHHLVVRDTLLVAGQRSDDVVSLSLDIRTGVPSKVRQRASVPSPTRILRVRD